MCTITATEFKRNFGKYNKLAETEEIIITSHGKPIYSVQPISIKKMKDLESIFGVLPEEATFKEDPYERG